MGYYSDKIFPNVNDFLTSSYRNHRKKILTTAHGSVLELGFGSGLSLEAYPINVSSIFGLEPNKGMIFKARERLKVATSQQVEIMDSRFII